MFKVATQRTTTSTMICSDIDDNFIQGMKEGNDEERNDDDGNEGRTTEAVKLLNDLAFRKVADKQPRLKNFHSTTVHQPPSSFNTGGISSPSPSSVARSGVITSKLRDSLLSRRSHHRRHPAPHLASSDSSSLSSSYGEVTESFDDQMNGWNDEYNNTSSSPSDGGQVLSEKSANTNINEVHGKENNRNGDGDSVTIVRNVQSETKFLIDQAHTNKGLKLYWMANCEIV